MVVSDRGESNPELFSICAHFKTRLLTVPNHTRHGNSFATMMAYKWAYDEGYDFVVMTEDDVAHHGDCLAWHREMHEDIPNLFCSCGWVFNLHAPIDKDFYLAPWFYAPNSAWKRDKLALLVRHAVPEYWDNMRQYVLETFPTSILHNRGAQSMTNFFEADGLAQYVLMEDKSQVAWRGTALVDHVGISGYNRPNGPVFEGTLDERITKVESLIADAHTRASIFGRAIVEREIGHVLPKREWLYSVTLPGGWSSEFVSESKLDLLPKRINSVPMPADAVITATLRS
jgi:hypothetical protein